MQVACAQKLEAGKVWPMECFASGSQTILHVLPELNSRTPLSQNLAKIFCNVSSGGSSPW